MLMSREAHVTGRHMLLSRDGQWNLCAVQFDYETLHGNIAMLLPILGTKIEVTIGPSNFFTEVRSRCDGLLPTRPDTPIISDTPTIYVVEDLSHLPLVAHDVIVNPNTWLQMSKHFSKDKSYQVVVVKLPKGSWRSPVITVKYKTGLDGRFAPTWQGTEDGFPPHVWVDTFLAWVNQSGFHEILWKANSPSSVMIYETISAKDQLKGLGTYNGNDIWKLGNGGMEEFFAEGDNLHWAWLQGMMLNGIAIPNIEGHTIWATGPKPIEIYGKPKYTFKDLPYNNDECDDPKCDCKILEPDDEWDEVGDDDGPKTDPMGKKFDPIPF